MKWVIRISLLSLVVAVAFLSISGAVAQEKKAAVSAETIAKGAELFKTKTCFTCHGADAKTPILPQYPKIAGQNAEYALQQMKDIKSGVRANGLSVAMKAIMHLVTDEEMEILAKYVSTMEP